MTMPPNNMGDTTIRVNESTKRRLAAKSQAAGANRTAGVKQKAQRQSAIDAALGKFVDDMDDDIAKRPSLARRDRNELGMSNHSNSGHGRPKRVASISKRAERTRDPLGSSEHSDSRAQEMSKRMPHKHRPSHASNMEQGNDSHGQIGFEDLKGGGVLSPVGRRNSREVSRRRTDRERCASPGPMKKRSESLGPIKKRSASPGPMKRQTESPGPVKKRSASLGPMNRERSGRSHSPGPLQRLSSRFLKKPPDSPGAMKRRSHSPGSLSSRRSERASRSIDQAPGALGDMLNKVGGQAKKKGARSVASAPAQDVKRPERRPSVGKYEKQRSLRSPGGGRQRPPPKSRSADAADILDAANKMDAKYDWQGYRPAESGTRKGNDSENTQSTHTGGSSEENDLLSPKPDRRSTMSRSKLKRSVSAIPGKNYNAPPSPAKTERDEDPNELAKQRIKRNNSMAPRMSRDESSESRRGGPEGGGGLQRAQSMMLHREMTRRGKSNSLMDLVQYKEEEIHSTSYFASNHVLVNRERMKRGLRPLTRNIAMDELARKSAESMAESNGKNPLKTTYVGNVLRGESIRSIHRSTMQQKQGRERANLLNPYFQDFGVGTAKGPDGMLYMCQLFSERLELALTDTTSPTEGSG